MTNNTPSTSRTLIVARVAKDRRFVLCGYGPCGTRIASIHRGDAQFGEDEEAVYPLTGFREGEGGIWRLGRYARQRWEQDQRRAFQGDKRARRRLAEGKSLRTRHARNLPELARRFGLRTELTTGVMTPMGGPIDLIEDTIVVCPKCERHNRLPAGLLNSA